MTKREERNRKRCLACENYTHNACPILANADTFDLDKCVKEYEFYKNIKNDSIEEFLLKSNPIMLLQYFSKSRPLAIGDVVITLRGGFGTHSCGKMLLVISDDNPMFVLMDRFGKKYGVDKNNWYMDVFRLDMQTFILDE